MKGTELDQVSGSQSMFSGPAISASPENFKKKKKKKTNIYLAVKGLSCGRLFDLHCGRQTLSCCMRDPVP